MIEYIILDNKNPKNFYNNYLVIKLFFIFCLQSIDLKYSGLFLLALFQYLIYFYIKENIDNLTKNINKWQSIIFIPLLAFLIFQEKTCIYDLFLIYPILYCVLMWIKSIKTTNIFCIKNEFTQNQLVYKVQEIPISFLYFIIVIYVKILNIVPINFEILLSIAIILALTLKIEYTHIMNAKSQYNISIVAYYMFSLITILFFYLVFFIISVDINKENYIQYASNIYASITNIAILNIASLFVLVQLNYQKFGSAYLLKKVFQSPILLFIVLLPAIILILSGHILENDIKFLPTLCLSIAFSSTLLLFAYVYIFLDTNIVMRSLFKDINYKDFENYKKNIINHKETNIDTISKIIITMLKNNDITVSHSLFYNFACWLKTNIRLINQKSYTYWEEENNKFNDFFMTLITALANSKDIVFHQNFILSVRNIVIKNITSENYKEYKILYNFMFEYLFLMLRNKNDQVAQEVYRAIYWNISKILLELPRCEIGDYDTVRLRHSTELFDFKKIFVDPYSKIIEIGIENKNVTFLGSFSFYEDLFTSPSMDDKKMKEIYKKWDGKIFEIFTMTRFQDEQLHRFLIDNNRTLSYFMRNYSIFMQYNYLSEQKTEYEYDDRIKNYVFHRIINIYEYAIINNKITHDSDFELIWGSIYGAIKGHDIENFKIYITIFTYLIKKICEKDKENIQNSSAVKIAWGRLYYIYNSFNEDFTMNVFKEFIQKKINQLQSDFVGLQDITFNQDKKNYRISDINILDQYNV